MSTIITTGNSPTVIVARQAIFERNLNVYAYELLFRPDKNQQSSGVTPLSGDLATTRVINHAFLELGIERVIGNQLAFVNLTRNFILSDDPLPFTQDRVVLEVLEDIEIDDEVIAAVRQLVSQGYTIALDDFVFHDSLKPLIELADIIKIDILAFTEQELIHHIEQLRDMNVKLLAEKVETKAQFDLCKQLGFDYFQGYFFSRPTVIEDKPLAGGHLRLFQIIAKLQEPDVEFADIEALISQDPTLSYKLLRLLNSAAMKRPGKIDTISKGLKLLGLKAIQTWSTLIALNKMHTEHNELMNNTLIRAKMCEQLASHYGCHEQTGFLVGLFSALDSIMARPMEQLLEALPLGLDIKQALLDRQGLMGQLLDNVIHFEQGIWDKVNIDKVSFEQFSESYVNATEWTIQSKQII